MTLGEKRITGDVGIWWSAADLPVEGVFMSITEASMVKQLVASRMRVVAYIWAIVHDMALAEDLYQDLCAEAVQKRSQIDTVEHLQNWLLQGARFRGIDALRRRESQPLVFDDSVYHLIEADLHEDKASARDLQQALDRCLNELAPDARRLVDLRYSGNLTGPEIARKLNRNLKTIYVTFTRIHRKLATCIQKSLAERVHQHG
ncbi:sigma-70 family RNA polymerase sigma factor [Planctomycetales bacterium ZRK34]|nr:sigma-70 family RNA polymerase sigma factor [Planctomycetales bacterium ZRK34]